MNLCIPGPFKAVRAILAIALALGLPASGASAQEGPAPATATLDVTSNPATGNWRYSGVVAVPAAAGAPVQVDTRIQNQTSREGYRDAAQASTGAAVARAGDTVVVPYSFEGAPLTLGEMRSAITVQVRDPLLGSALPALFAVSPSLTPTAVCGCPPKGCVRTQGYWGNKPGVIWPAPYSRTALFFSSGLTWQQILDTPPRGSAYIILAHQYIAAVLNRAAGASAPAGVQSVIDAARTWFGSGTTPASCGPGACGQQKIWAGILDTYNNGQYPGAPTSCD